MGIYFYSLYKQSSLLFILIYNLLMVVTSVRSFEPKSIHRSSFCWIYFLKMEKDLLWLQSSSGQKLGKENNDWKLKGKNKANSSQLLEWSGKLDILLVLGTLTWVRFDKYIFSVN